MRGAISLAAALTVPAATAEGHVVEQRDAVVFITAVVIVVTLTFLGPTPPTVVRRARFPDDEDKTAELTLARCHLLNLRRESGPSGRAGMRSSVWRREAPEFSASGG
jgi:NhaP-type Na+/H+ or K+/H+ antiporter